jgi:hypothetical protein
MFMVSIMIPPSYTILGLLALLVNALPILGSACMEYRIGVNNLLYLPLS